jgi:NAD(P)-dependent dehydrogenase (short-subunit alcohol dehydrogenase family)
MDMPNGSYKNVMELFRLDGRVALVTGGSKGLGRVIAQALAEAGADVIVASRTLEDCRKAADEIASSTGRRAAGFAVDVTSADELKRLAAEIEGSLGAVDILVNNAGINIRGLIDEINQSDFEAVMETNVTAPFLCSKIFGPKMAERGWGRVINLGSIMSVISLPGRVSYASSKAAIMGMTRTLGLEWAAKGVTVNALCPGLLDTDMTSHLTDEARAFYLEQTPLGRTGRLDEVGAVVRFLMSEEASYVNGVVLPVDGGLTA